MITVDLLARRGRREINGTFTGMAEHVWALINDLVAAGWVIAHALVEVEA